MEAIVEGWVSTMELHCSEIRGLTSQEGIEDEVWVALNGPELPHCNGSGEGGHVQLLECCKDGREQEGILCEEVRKH